MTCTDRRTDIIKCHRFTVNFSEVMRNRMLHRHSLHCALCYSCLCQISVCVCVVLCYRMAVD